MFVVYCHRCQVTQKSYVGWASVDEGQAPFDAMMRRWREHASQRKSKCAFHVAIRKHGVDAWNHEVIEVVSTLEDAKRAEIRAIVEQNSYVFDAGSDGYNMTRGGDGLVGYKFTPEQIGRRSCTRMSRHPRRVKPVAQIKERKKSPPISDETRQKLRDAARARPRERIMAMTAAAHRPLANEKRAVQRHKRIVRCDLAGNVLATYTSVKDAAIDVNGNRGNIASAARDGRKTASGFTWRYV